MKKKNEKHLQSRSLADFQTSKGFTLAEVLITLGIIGVVAAMTIPTLMVDINTRQWETAADVFEKKLNESLKTMNSQQTIYGHTTTLSFVEELSKNFKINKICKNNELQNCFPKTVYWGAGEATPEEVDMATVKQATDFGLEDWGTELIGVQFANGVAGLVAYNPACSGDPYSNQFNGSACISMLYDTSGGKNPNTSGKDLGNYGIISRLGSADCAFEIGGTCYGAPFSPTSLSQAECEAKKSDLGIQNCPTDNDYWAGAVNACGGVSKLASAANLTSIAEYLYETNSLDSPSIEINKEKMKALGFVNDELFGPIGDVKFFVFSNVEKENGEVGYRNFYLTSTMNYYTSRTSSDRQVVCVK